ncbi:MAG: anhydro-N-acetylmuramic acid kinase [Cyanobacteria bacterium]|nr:anhydro-N-acetylmuramic acid kinase [Cyanobacteriota bacterium]MDW8200063.1 anhydro-N-acetylmuramic acid kinase [Cyanobacteriota bacterium SKYGB_h_bin112]
MTRVVGLISGTSVDGIDAALVDIAGNGLDLNVTLVAGATYPYPEAVRSQILAVCAGQPLSMVELAALDDAIAYEFAQAALAIQAGHAPASLIGSHGQTVYHRPPDNAPHSSMPLGYSLQLGRGDVIAHLTKTTTISNFRVADIAAQGQGAPLVARVDACLLGHDTQTRCVQNLGGIGNVTYLPARNSSPNWLAQVRGWDTGPGNVLIDLAVQHFSGGQRRYDQDGAWAASGTVCSALVERWLQHPFFQQAPPKSTGRELFGQDYLMQCLADAKTYNLSPADILASLTELTVVAIVHSYQSFLPKQPDQVILCGGGSLNGYLRKRLQTLVTPISVVTTDDVGLSAGSKEAIAFAVLAYWRQHNMPGNLPQVTGATQEVCLGDIHPVYPKKR